jgi:DNA-binding transcriptional regulator YiaG
MYDMNTKQVLELLVLKGWSKRHLAAQLCVSEDSIHRWFRARKVPHGPAVILLRHWLKQAKEASDAPPPRKVLEPV